MFHSLFTTVITFCQFLYEVYELCFTVCLVQLLLFASSCMKSTSCVSQERAFLKPCWRLYNILLFSRCDMMLLVIICSISLQQMHVNDVGL